MRRRLADEVGHGPRMRGGTLAGTLGLLVLAGLALLATLPGWARSATPNPATFRPVADSYVQADAAGTNYGTKTALRADGSPVVRAYLRFDVKGLAGSVSSAILKVRSTSSHSTGYLAAGVANNVWGETTITFSNAPPPGASVGSSGAFAANAWTQVNVTSLVSGNGLVSFALTTTSGTAMALQSREAGTANAPQLVVTTTSSDTTPPATPTALTAVASGQNRIDVGWTAPADPDVVGYGVYRDGSATPIPVAATSYSDTGLSAGSTHSYRVDAVDGAGNRSAPTAPQSATTQTPAPGAAIRAAFYYPWFPQGWSQLGYAHFSRYHPTLGDYDSADPAVIRAHIAAMQYGNIDAGIASWWGVGHHTDGRIPALLAGAAGTSFKWALYQEQEGQTDQTAAQIRADLVYIRDNYATSPNYLRVDGRFVVFVYKASNDGCGMADRWAQANTVGAYIVLHSFTGYQSCASQPDAWHVYGPAQPVRVVAGSSYNISPGFWRIDEAQPRLARDLARWRKNIRDMIASGERWQLITSFNEWGEGTPVESAVEWPSASGHGDYLDALHANGAEPTP